MVTYVRIPLYPLLVVVDNVLFQCSKQLLQFLAPLLVSRPNVTLMLQTNVILSYTLAIP